jgi:hypothetical protein
VNVDGGVSRRQRTLAALTAFATVVAAPPSLDESGLGFGETGSRRARRGGRAHRDSDRRAGA